MRVDDRVAFYVGPLALVPQDAREFRLSVRDLGRVDRSDPYGGDLYRWVRGRRPEEMYTLHSGDTINALTGPTVLCKARRRGDRAVLAKLSQARHWAPAYALRDNLSWSAKHPSLCWRGTALTAQRRRAVRHAASVQGCDIVARHDRTLAEMCEHKWLLSLEGRDVATNLKWIAASGSCLVMPPPTCDSWAMETTLRPWVHYVPLQTDLSDLAETVRWLAKHDAECATIARASQQWFRANFGDRRREASIMQQVLDAYQRAQHAT